MQLNGSNDLLVLQMQVCLLPISLPPTYFTECKDIFEVSVTEHQDDPKTLTQAQSHSEWTDWQAARPRNCHA
jgi:hypothetical protein